MCLLIQVGFVSCPLTDSETKKDQESTNQSIVGLKD